MITWLDLHKNKPRIPHRAAPESERLHFSALETALDNMALYIMHFQDALALLDWSLIQQANIKILDPTHLGTIAEREERAILGGWIHIAFRDAALTLWHFYHSIQGVKKSLHLCESLSGVIKDKKMEGPVNKFKSYFPGYDKIRHAVAHAGENHQDARSTTQNTIKGPYMGNGMNIQGENSSVTLVGVQTGRTYQHTYQGKIASYELSQESLDRLVEIQDHVFGEFLLPKL